MTDRYNYLTVIFERDLRDDDAEVIIRAIEMIRGILSVTPNIASPLDALAIGRAKAELRDKVWELLKP